MIVAGVVATNNAGRHALMQRTGSGCLSNDGEINSGAVSSKSYLGRAQAEGRPRPSICGRTGCFYLDWAALSDKATLYGGHAALWACGKGPS
jgi:hypothetical protein